MRKDRDETYLKDISEAIGKIEEYLRRRKYPLFKSRGMFFDAVVREVEITGDASTTLSARFREKHNKLPIRTAIGMKNQLIHGYTKIKPWTVWQTCKKDLPKLKKQIEDILNNK